MVSCGYLLRSLCPVLRCRREAGVSPLVWGYLSSVSPKRHCCRVRAVPSFCQMTGTLPPLLDSVGGGGRSCVYAYGSNAAVPGLDMVTVDDYDRCGPAKLTLHDRNYFLAAAGRRTTYIRNKDAFDEITIVPKMLRDVSQNSLETSTLDIDLDFPIGLSPVALQMLADPRGELATVEAISPFRTIMIMSSFATTTIEDVGRAAAGTSLTMWMQMYIFDNRTWTVELVQRAEKAGFKGVVLTADSPVETILTCNGRRDFQFPEAV
ncbi:hydroxyacid oxidase [Trichonephila clavipes]|nr:hydroxyacid oxidase [Trichonephila clavipes]